MLDQYDLDNIDQIKAISEPTRWRMLSLLILEEMTGAQLARMLKIPRPRAHYHLKTLERVGLVEFQEERTRNGMVEKYYRAIARQYLTDKLIHRGRELPENNEIVHETVEAYSEITRAMLELANADVLQPDHFNTLLRYGYNFQEDVYLTDEQVDLFKVEIRNYVRRLLETGSQNHAAASSNSLLHLRFTFLVTPAAAFSFDRPPEKKETRVRQPVS